MRVRVQTMRLALLVALTATVGTTLFDVQPARAQGAGVPVTIAVAQKQDVLVLQRAIGTVQAFQSVLIRARVDGTLDKVLFTEGQSVKPGDLLAQLDPRPYQAVLDQAQAKKAADTAMLISARDDLIRYRDLANSQVASRQKLEQSIAAVAQGEAALRGDDATIAAAQLNLDFTRITSPIDGRVGLRLIDTGNYIRAADTTSPGLVTIAQIQPIALLFTLPQDVLPAVQAAMTKGQLPVIAYNSDDTTKLSDGKLLTVDSTIDSSTGTIKLKATFANKDNRLWPGQFVNVRMQTDTRSAVTTVPSGAVQRGPNGYYTFIVKPDETVAVQPIEIAQDDGKTAVISEGVKPGDKVVTSGQSRLTSGTKIAATEAKPAT